jgi:hypothetical protein
MAETVLDFLLLACLYHFEIIEMLLLRRCIVDHHGLCCCMNTTHLKWRVARRGDRASFGVHSATSLLRLCLDLAYSLIYLGEQKTPGLRVGRGRWWCGGLEVLEVS